MLLRSNIARLSFCVFMIGCGDAATDPDADTWVEDRGGMTSQEALGFLGGADRTELSGDIAHYTFTIPVGDGPFDEVRLHRIVRERRANRPIRTDGAVMMLAGGYQTTTTIFLPGDTAETSVAVALAADDIDVWMMDWGWTGVPLDTTDFGFMADWGVPRDAAHARTAIAVARVLRLLSGQGLSRMKILGFSYGVPVAFRAAAEDANSWLKHIDGVVAVDGYFAFENEADRANACALAAPREGALAAGVYEDNFGSVLAAVGGLALADPAGASPVFPGFTNGLAGLFLGTTTFALEAQVPFFHFVAGDLDANGIPSTLTYTDATRWYSLLAGVGEAQPWVYMPMRAIGDFFSGLCDTAAIGHYDDVGDIDVPLYYLGAAGGGGDFGVYQTGLTSSTDITVNIVGFFPPEARAVDFGHADLFLAADAPSLAWSPLASWIQSN